MSPTVFREGTARFYFFSREESRMHIHVMVPNGEAKFWLTPNVECAGSVGLSPIETSRLKRVIEERKEEIVDAWNRHFSG